MGLYKPGDTVYIKPTIMNYSHLEEWSPNGILQKMFTTMEGPFVVSEANPTDSTFIKLAECPHVHIFYKETMFIKSVDA